MKKKIGDGNGFVFQRKDTKGFVIFFKDYAGNQIRENVGKVGLNEKEWREHAEKKLKERQAEVVKNIYERREKIIKFEKLVELYEKDINANEVKKIFLNRSQETLRRRLKILNEFFIGLQIDKITSYTIKNFIDWRGKQKNKKDITKNIAPLEVKRGLLTLKMIMNYANENGYENDIATGKIKLPKISSNEDSKRHRILTIEEEKQMLDTLESLNYTELKQWFNLCLYTLSRPAEILYLKVSDIDFKKEVLTIRQRKLESKLGVEAATKYIPYGKIDIVKNIFETYKGKEKNTRLFTNSFAPITIDKAGQEKLNLYMLEKQFKEVREKCNLDDKVIPYTLRHTGITRLIDTGLPERRVIKYSGHQNTKMLQVYYHGKMNADDLSGLNNNYKTDRNLFINNGEEFKRDIVCAH